MAGSQQEYQSRDLYPSSSHSPIEEATYTLYTDGGGISALLLNFANKQSVSRLFDALHARMHDGK
jgi:hypothetical protein